MSPEFRAGERDVCVESKCIECGANADAYASADDGDICRACCLRDEEEEAYRADLKYERWRDRDIAERGVD